MTKKHCDRCDKGEDFGMISGGILTIVFPPKSILEGVLSIKKEIDLCRDCFNSFMEFTKE